MNVYILEAPFPAVEDQIIMPQPRWGDNENLDSRTQIKQTMTGLLHAYKSDRPGQNQFKWTFNLLQSKQDQLLEFVRKWHAETWQVQREEGVIRVNLTVNPLTLSLENRSLYGNSHEAGLIELSFEQVP